MKTNWNYFIKRIEKFISSKGRLIIGFRMKFLKRGVAPNAVVQSWQGTEGGISCSKQGMM